MRISRIAVVHHRNEGALARCLQAAARNLPTVPLLVLDTGAGGGSLRSSHPLAERRRIANRSYAAAVNEALRDAPGELVLVLNDDVQIGPCCASAWTTPFADPSVAMVGPLLFTPSGSAQSFGPLYRLHTAALAGADARALREVPWLSGAAFVVRRSAALAVGGMDASLRFYNEDLEWGLRLRAGGYRLLLSGCDALHEGGASTPTGPRFLVEGLRGGMRVAHRHRSFARRAVQRIALALVGSVLAAFGPARDREAWRAIARAARRDAFLDSPFGATLADEVPGGLAAWPPGRRHA